jgi:hypothetical protein
VCVMKVGKIEICSVQQIAISKYQLNNVCIPCLACAIIQLVGLIQLGRGIYIGRHGVPNYCKRLMSINSEFCILQILVFFPSNNCSKLVRKKARIEKFYGIENKIEK